MTTLSRVFRSPRPVLVATALASLVFLSCKDGSSAGEAANVADAAAQTAPAPAAPGAKADFGFQLPTVDGRSLGPKSFPGQVVVVDFWATWCGPCRAVAPVLDELAEQNDKVLIAKLNVDEQQKIAYQYQVSSIPTFSLFKDGKMADRMMGAAPRTAFDKFIERNM